MSIRNKILSRFRSVWDAVQRGGSNSPIETQEQHDLYKSILASTYKNLRRERFSIGTNDRPVSGAGVRRRKGCMSVRFSLLSKAHRKELEEVIEAASLKLERETKVHKLSNKMMRYELHNLIGPELVSMFRAFDAVETQLFQNSSCDHDYNATNDSVHRTCREILYEEHSGVLRCLSDLHHTDITKGDCAATENTPMLRRQRALYLEKKKLALETIFDFQGWDLAAAAPSAAPSTAPSPLPSPSPSPTHGDAFGYHLSLDNETNQGIRYHQMINLARAVILRDQHLGYAVLALQSTLAPYSRSQSHSNSLPPAGRGLFVDGFAPAGSILALFPGQIWPKEHTLPLTHNQTDTHAIDQTQTNPNPIISFFQDDPNHHLSLRYDGILIDSRKSPYTVLDQPNSNPFAIAHVANHPPPNTIPNCATFPINFTHDLPGQSLERFVPNVYAKPPNLLGPGLFEREVVTMRGMGLMASRDIQDEELYYDYRLSPSVATSTGSAVNGYPDWYHIVDEEELRNRWSTQ